METASSAVTLDRVTLRRSARNGLCADDASVAVSRRDPPPAPRGFHLSLVPGAEPAMAYVIAEGDFTPAPNR